MSKIALSPSALGTGTLTIAAPNTNSDRTLTLPDNTGTVITTASTFAGTGPAFLVAVNGNASLAAATFTKAPLNTETFDTNNNFDSTTNYRFTPTVAGYYQINTMNAQLVNGVVYNAIYKNGSLYYQFGGSNIAVQGSALVYLNGSTDYIELYLYSTIATGTLNCVGLLVSMSGALVRAA